MLDFHSASLQEKREAFAAVHSTWPHADDPSVHLTLRLHAVQQSRAEWFVGTRDGQVVTSCGVYPLRLFGPDGVREARGFGAVYTDVSARGQGHAQNLMRFVMDLYMRQGPQDFILFSDIDPRYYEKIGFHRLPSFAWECVAEAPSPDAPWSLVTTPVGLTNPGPHHCRYGLDRDHADSVWTLAKQGHPLRKTWVQDLDGNIVYWILSHKDGRTYTFLESDLPQDAAHWEIFRTIIAADCHNAGCDKALGWWTSGAIDPIPSPLIRPRETGILMWASGLGTADPWLPEIQTKGFRAFLSEQF